MRPPVGQLVALISGWGLPVNRIDDAEKTSEILNFPHT